MKFNRRRRPLRPRPSRSQVHQQLDPLRRVFSCSGWSGCWRPNRSSPGRVTFVSSMIAFWRSRMRSPVSRLSR